MRHFIKTSKRPFRTAVAAMMAASVFLAPAPLAAAGPPSSADSILLPGAAGAEGIAAGNGTVFYAGDLVRGDIFRGDIREGAAELFIDAPDGRAAVGLKMDKRHELLFVAGGGTGQVYVYSTVTRSTVATYQLTTQAAFINDVALTPEGAWFTNSRAGELYFIPVSQDGVPGGVQVLPLSGPAADTSSAFNLNGIAAAAGGRALIVAHSGNAALYTVDPSTGVSEVITGLTLPNVDGILVQGRTLWAVQNFINQVSRVELSAGVSSGQVEDVITNPLFVIPTTVALFGNELAVVNAKFGIPGVSYDVAVVDARN